MTNKKSQGIAVNTIVAAAIALGVLVVIFLILTGQFSTTSKNLNSCAAKNGKCASEISKDKIKPSCTNPEKDEDKDYRIPLYISDFACGDSKLCCIRVG